MKLERIKEKAHQIYSTPHAGCSVFIDKEPKTLRHEDPQLGGSGTWIDVSVFVPDDPPESP